jgi:uncharacterized protein (TIGR02996 family)
MAKHKGPAVSSTILLGLLQDIKANPDEDGPRLILADYLEEHGEPRGEFIRLQCQLASLETDDPDRETLASRAWEIADRPGLWGGEQCRALGTGGAGEAAGSACSAAGSQDSFHSTPPG